MAYETIYVRVPAPVKERIESFRRRNGYPSNSQAINAMVGYAFAWETFLEILDKLHKDGMLTSNEIAKEISRALQVMKSVKS